MEEFDQSQENQPQSPLPPTEGGIPLPNPLNGGSERQGIVSESYAKTIPKKYRGTYLKASRGEAGYAGAVKAKCQECVGFEDIAERVGGCTAYRCPLWKYRPHQDKGEE